MNDTITIFWFRRDLRFHDNAGLFHALSASSNVIPLFIFDTDILDKLDNPTDLRVQFIYETLSELNKQLAQFNSSFLVKIGKPISVFESLLNDYTIGSVTTNLDYEPYERQRDLAVKTMLNNQHIPFEAYHDHTIFEPTDILKADGLPYTVFTPYSKRWKAAFVTKTKRYYESKSLMNNFVKMQFPFPALSEIGFKPTNDVFTKPNLEVSSLANYNETRDFPAIDSTSRNGIHLRFGTISTRELGYLAQDTNDVYLNELIWREFFMQILFHFPSVEKKSFHKKYDGIPWRNDETEFARWCEGKTGYPMVDAGMRQLNATGFMHNRVRMVTASFLTKHLLIDWRWGESYFASHLIDFELASNNGNWQWAAGCGCDAVPYFRVFNPSEQQRKFDPDLVYCKKWIPELFTSDYPQPIVDHVVARNRAIDLYKKHLSQFA